MKIIVCGSRNYSDNKLLSNTLREYTRRNKVTTIVLGTEPGAETLAAEWAMANKVRLNIVPTLRREFGERAIEERNMEILRRHQDVGAVLHFSGCEASEDLCVRALDSRIVVDDVVGPN